MLQASENNVTVCGHIFEFSRGKEKWSKGKERGNSNPGAEQKTGKIVWAASKIFFYFMINCLV